MVFIKLHVIKPLKNIFHYERVIRKTKNIMINMDWKPLTRNHAIAKVINDFIIFTNRNDKKHIRRPGSITKMWASLICKL